MNENGQQNLQKRLERDINATKHDENNCTKEEKMVGIPYQA